MHCLLSFFQDIQGMMTRAYQITAFTDCEMITHVKSKHIIIHAVDYRTHVTGRPIRSHQH
ncbi:hypothetical protein BEH84_05441 [Eisenbergiella tayi]|uniref:Uncharacterized protein n=1 Tax=Eisenbergiella tayi TaxID=1432052 RepID=A0A1E3AHH9_9FIRM|nr:hypothetical protein BEH84_05441 [Eisenbergiella tayi]